MCKFTFSPLATNENSFSNITQTQYEKLEFSQLYPSDPYSTHTILQAHVQVYKQKKRRKCGGNAEIFKIISTTFLKHELAPPPPSHSSPITRRKSILTRYPIKLSAENTSETYKSKHENAFSLEKKIICEHRFGFLNKLALPKSYSLEKITRQQISRSKKKKK